MERYDTPVDWHGYIHAPIEETGSTHYCFQTVDPTDNFSLYHMELSTSAPYTGTINVLDGFGNVRYSLMSKTKWSTGDTPFKSRRDDNVPNKWVVLQYSSTVHTLASLKVLLKILDIEELQILPYSNQCTGDLDELCWSKVLSATAAVGINPCTFSHRRLYITNNALERAMFELKNCNINSNTFIIASSTSIPTNYFHLVGVVMDPIELVQIVEPSENTETATYGTTSEG